MYPTDETIAITNRESILTEEQPLSSEYQTQRTLAALTNTETSSSKQNRAPSPLAVEVPLEARVEPEVIEESGPVQYLGKEEEEEDEEGGLDDEEIEGLAYDEDPLLHSDYEDEGVFSHEILLDVCVWRTFYDIHIICIIMLQYMYMLHGSNFLLNCGIFRWRLL